MIENILTLGKALYCVSKIINKVSVYGKAN